MADAWARWVGVREGERPHAGDIPQGAVEQVVWIAERRAARERERAERSHKEAKR